MFTMAVHEIFNGYPYLLLPLSLLYFSHLSWIPNDAFFGALILLTFVLLYQTQSSLLYHPEMPGNERLYVAYPPEGFDFEEDTITTEDGIHLHCYFVKQNSDIMKDVPTLIYFHGNAGTYIYSTDFFLKLLIVACFLPFACSVSVLFSLRFFSLY